VPRKRSGSGALSSALDEREQVGVDDVGVRRAHPVRQAGIDLELRALHELGRKEARGADGQDLVVVAVHHQGRHIDLLQLFGKSVSEKALMHS
jgi:hypothetical protein